jgi:GNAT superfamily N-acetyltransferase
VRCDVTDDVGEFLDATGGYLRSRPVEHNLILTLAERVRNDGDGAVPSRWAWATDGLGRVAGAAIQSPGDFRATMTPMATGAVDALVERLDVEAPGMPGANGEAGTVAAFAGAWATARRVSAHPVESERLYRLGALRSPGPAPGRLRPAGTADLATVVAWFEAFNAETGHAPPPGIDRHGLIARRVEHGQVWLWDVEGVATSMACTTAPLAGAVRIGPVYTPPDHRGQGYAAACVGGVSAGARAAGARDCLLYTQLTNPVSNKIYQRLGYEAVAEILVYRFG